MRAEDLRIGNLLKYNGDKIVCVLGIMNDGRVLLSDVGFREIRYLKPIPITKTFVEHELEMYLDIEGSKESEGDVYSFKEIDKKKGFMLNYIPDENTISIIDNHYGDLLEGIKFVHDLQNAHYMFTKKEILIYNKLSKE